MFGSNHDGRLRNVGNQRNVIIGVVVATEYFEPFGSQFIKGGDAELGRRLEGFMTEAGQNTLIIGAVQSICIRYDGIHGCAQKPTAMLYCDDRP